MGLLKLVFFVFLILLVIYLGAGFYVAYAVSHQRFPGIEVSPSLISKDYQDVSFKTADQLTLRGWFFPKGGRVVILVHGLTQNRHDRNYYFVPLARDLLAEGYSVLTFDLRGHGASDGKATTYGQNESNDVMAAVDFVKSKDYKSERVAIVANSAGAISTLMAGRNLTGKVGALVIDSVPTRFEPVFVRRLWIEKHVPTFVTPFALFIAKRLYGLDLSVINPIDKVAEIPDIPMLFFHGEKDETFFAPDGAKVAAAHPPSKFVVFKNAPHIATYRTDPDLWRNEVFSFLKENLK